MSLLKLYGKEGARYYIFVLVGIIKSEQQNKLLIQKLMDSATHSATQQLIIDKTDYNNEVSQGYLSAYSSAPSGDLGNDSQKMIFDLSRIFPFKKV